MTLGIDAKQYENKLQVHDCYLTDMHFDKGKKCLELYLVDPWENKASRRIIFMGVIGFSVTACEFWGEGTRLHEIHIRDKKELEIIPVLFRKLQGEPVGTGNLKEEELYIEAEILFICGDKLIVACECIEEKPD